MLFLIIQRQRDWWTPLLRGVFLLLLGALALLFPEPTAVAFVFVLGGFFLLDGFVVLGELMVARREPHPWFSFAEGVAEILFGILLILFPQILLGFLLVLVILWLLLFRGVGAVFFGLRAPLSGSYRTLFVLSGFLSFLFGVLLIFFPKLLVFFLAVYALLFGVLLLAYAITLWRTTKH